MTFSPEDVTLRPATELDAGLYAKFPPSAEIVRMYGGTAGPLERRTAKQSKAWLTQFRDTHYARLIESRGRPVGHVWLHGVSVSDRKARLKHFALNLNHLSGVNSLHEFALAA